MSMDKPFRVEVTVDAPRDEVWRTLTEPERIRHWFGWDYDGLEDEIELIFVKDATLVPPERIELGAEGWIELIEDGPRTVVRAVKPGETTGWEDVYGDVEEGWITFFNQLRHRIARHPTSARRMVVLRGEAGLPALPGEPWYEGRYQRGADVDGELAIVFAKPGGETTLLVTTYDLDDDAFAAADERWRAWWSAQAAGSARRG
jgi:hypothetical protein